LRAAGAALLALSRRQGVHCLGAPASPSIRSKQPILAITWAVERFPVDAALDLPGRNDRAIAVIVSLGPKVPSGGLRPDVPRGLAFFLGETETVGTTYTCIPPRQGLTGDRLQCVYPHIKYIALRRGGAGRCRPTT